MPVFQPRELIMMPGRVSKIICALVLAIAGAGALVLTDMITLNQLGLSPSREFSTLIRDIATIPANVKLMAADSLRSVAAELQAITHGNILMPRTTAAVLLVMNAMVAMFALTGLLSRQAPLHTARALHSPGTQPHPYTRPVATQLSEAATQPATGDASAAPKNAGSYPAPGSAPAAASGAAADQETSTPSLVARLQEIRQSLEGRRLQAAATHEGWQSLQLQLGTLETAISQQQEPARQLQRMAGSFRQKTNECRHVLERLLAHDELARAALRARNSLQEHQAETLRQLAGGFASGHAGLLQATETMRLLTLRIREAMAGLPVLDDFAGQSEMMAAKATATAVRHGQTDHAVRAMTERVGDLARQAGHTSRNLMALLVAAQNAAGLALSSLSDSSATLTSAQDDFSRFQELFAADTRAAALDTADGSNPGTGKHLSALLGEADKAAGRLDELATVLTRQQQGLSAALARLALDANHLAWSAETLETHYGQQTSAIATCETLVSHLEEHTAAIDTARPDSGAEILSGTAASTVSLVPGPMVQEQDTGLHLDISVCESNDNPHHIRGAS